MFDFVSYSFVADLFVFVIAHFLINASDKSSVNLNSKPTILYLIDIHSKKKSYRARLELLQAEKKRNGCKSVFTTSLPDLANISRNVTLTKKTEKKTFEVGKIFLS